MYVESVHCRNRRQCADRPNNQGKGHRTKGGGTGRPAWAEGEETVLPTKQ